MKNDGILKLIYAVMCGGGWFTIPELRERLATHGRTVLDTSISARIRDLRKPPWRRIVDSRTRQGTKNTIEYCLIGSWQHQTPSYDGNQARLPI